MVSSHSMDVSLSILAGLEVILTKLSECDEWLLTDILKYLRFSGWRMDLLS